MAPGNTALTKTCKTYNQSIKFINSNLNNAEHLYDELKKYNFIYYHFIDSTPGCCQSDLNLSYTDQILKLIEPKNVELFFLILKKNKIPKCVIKHIFYEYILLPCRKLKYKFVILPIGSVCKDNYNGCCCWLIMYFINGDQWRTKSDKKYFRRKMNIK
jgi:hypothetical protein